MTAFVATFACVIIGWVLGVVLILLLDPYNLRSGR